MSLTVVADYRCHTGEGPVWHPDEELLYWVDIPNGRLFGYDPATDTHTQRYETDVIGGFTIQDEGLLLFEDGGRIERLVDGETTVVAEIDDEADSRFNDVIADPRGRVFCGTMPTAERPGRLYRLDTDGSVTRLFDDAGLPNGMGFSPDQRHFYFTDSEAGCIYQFDYEPATGAITNRDVIVDVQDEAGVPDGMTVDTDGYLWTARWNGGCLVRYDPAGNEVDRIDIPARKASSITFGGPAYTDAYVTTALTDGKREDEGEQAGALLRFEPTVEVEGRPEFRSDV